MDYIKVVDLIHEIPPKDRDKLRQLLSSICKDEVYQLYTCIVRRLNNGIDLTNASLWKDVYANKPINLNIFRKRCLELLRNIEICLPYIQLASENTTALLLKYYAQHHIDKFYEDQWEKSKQINVPTDSEEILLEYQLNYTHYNYLIQHPIKAKQNHIPATDQTLDTHYFLQKIKLICHALNEAQFTKFDYTVQNADFIIERIENSLLKTHPIISIYLHIYALFTHSQPDEHLTKTKEILSRLSALHTQEQKTIYQYFINFCIIQINRGHAHFEQELLDIFISYNQTISDPYISPFRFKNIVNLSLKLKRYAFAEEFITHYGQKLPEDIRSTTIAFNMAKLYYETKKYDMAIDTLLYTVNDDLTYNLSAKLLIAKTFYEKGEYTFLSSFLESFRIYILRNKEMNTTLKKNYHVFIRFCGKLIALQNKKEKEIAAFNTKILSMENLPDKLWLLEKINELGLSL